MKSEPQIVRPSLELRGAARWFIASCAALLVSAAPGLEPNPPPHERRIILLPKPGAAAALERLQQVGEQRVLRHFPRLGQMQIVELPAGAVLPDWVDGYQRSGLVRFAEPDYRVAAAALPNDPHFQDGTQWWLNNYGQVGGWPDADLDGPEAWDVLNSAPQVTVAILDSGVRPTHEDLAPSLWINPIDGTHGFNALAADHDPWDDNGHGTHIAGIIGAAGNNSKGIAGVTWQVPLMICKFLDQDGNGYVSDAIRCIEFARENGARVLNLSWGGSDSSHGLSNALWFARADGLSVVAAAGNNAANLDSSPYYPASLDLDNLISVGASTRNETTWNLSSYGAAGVDLFAPGAAVYSCSAASDTGYSTRNGTSMASACVAGAAALLLAREPSLAPQQVRNRLLDAVDIAPAYVGKCVSGGRLNLRKVLDLPSLSLTSIGVGTAEPGIQVRLTGQPGHVYLLQASAGLSAWSSLATNRLVSPEWIYEEKPLSEARYFRARPAD